MIHALVAASDRKREGLRARKIRLESLIQGIEKWNPRNTRVPVLRAELESIYRQLDPKFGKAQFPHIPGVDAGLAAQRNRGSKRPDYEPTWGSVIEKPIVRAEFEAGAPESILRSRRAFESRTWYVTERLGATPAAGV